MLRVRFQQIQNQQHEHQRRRLKREAVGAPIITPIDRDTPPVGPEYWYEGTKEVGYKPFISYGEEGHTAQPIDPNTGRPLPPPPGARGSSQASAGFFGFLTPERMVIVGLAAVLIYTLTRKSEPIIVSTPATAGAAK